MPDHFTVLPSDALIAPAKLTDYLLKLLPASDKSRFLARAGYTPADPARLERDIREQLLPVRAVFVDETDYRWKYEIRGVLVGPNGTALRVRSFWVVVKRTGETRFVTLYPDKP
jgi:hypothetical protein